MAEFDENGGIYKGMKLYSFVDNHDVDRIMSKLNQKDHIYPVYTLLYTLPGIPSLYYGSEWGIEGKKEGSNDDFLRPALSMEDLEKEQDSPVMDWVKKLGEVHKKFSQCLAYGRYRELLLTNRQYAFARISDGKAAVIAVNCDDAPAQFSFPNPIGKNCCKDVFLGCEKSVECDKIAVSLDGNSGSIFLFE